MGASESTLSRPARGAALPERRQIQMAVSSEAANRPSVRRSQVQFYPNDPESAPLEVVPLPRLEGNGPRWRFIGARLRAGRWRPGTRSFQAGQLQVALARTVSAWEEFLGRPLQRWQSGT